MRNRSAVATGLTAASMLLLAACADVPPTEPGGGGPEPDALFRATAQPVNHLDGTLDATFVQIAREVPGFGGLYYDAAGELVVVMAASATTDRTAVASALREHARQLRIEPAGISTMRVREGRYDFIQLDAMHRGVVAVLGLAGTVFTDADEVRNRVVIGVEDDAAAAAVRRHLTMLALPTDAVIVERAAPIQAEQTLRERVRPVAGGLSINFVRGTSGFLCTLGFNVRAPNRPGVEGFVTNSHCSDTRGEVIPTPYWQHSRAVANTFIGLEAHDAPYLSGGACPEGRRCRWSDALGVRYDEGVENALGAIYRTTMPSILPADTIWTIDPANPRWQIVDENSFPIVGQVLHKTGRRTGWTFGNVTSTCTNSNVSGVDITYFCQDRVATESGGGDSGSPYFERIGETNQVRLAGIHWGSGGGTTVMSAMRNIRCENEGPVPWITFPGQTPPATPVCAR
jgi:hypothetical protein